MGRVAMAPRRLLGRAAMTFYKNVWLWAILAVCIFATLNILFW